MLSMCYEKKCPNCHYKLKYTEIKSTFTCPKCGLQLKAVKVKQGCLFYGIGLSVLTIIFIPVFNWVYIKDEFMFLRFIVLIIMLFSGYIIEKWCFTKITEI